MSVRTAGLRAALVAATAVVALAGCSTGSDAVATGGGTFDFVSPGGKTDIAFDPPASRGTIGTLAGDSVMEPGTQVGVDDFPGQVVVVNVWGQWCGPCRGEADDLEEVYSASKDRGVAFLGINVRDNNRSKAQDFMVDQKVAYPSIYDPSMRSLIAFGKGYPTSVVPTTLVLDKQHRVAAVYLRELLAEDLQPMVDKLAAESADA